MHQLVPVKRFINFKELTTKNLINYFPQKETLMLYLPDFQNPSKLDKSFVINVS